jgi:Domain of unknown function (DUF4278)
MQLRYRGIPYQLSNSVHQDTDSAYDGHRLPMQYRGAQVRLSYSKLTLPILAAMSSYTAMYRGVPYQLV